jgi:hypothetical protein
VSSPNSSLNRDSFRRPSSRDTLASLRDLDIRRALRAKLVQRHAGDAHTLMVEEMELCLNAARVDLAVVNGRLEGFEIKSDRDRLDRLAGQADVYNRVFDRMTVVSGTRHLHGVVEAVPDWWGVLVAERVGGEVELREIRAALANPTPDPYSVAQLLWRPEALAILEDLDAARGLRSKPLPFLWSALVDLLEPVELARRVRDTVVARGDWRGSRRSSEGGETSRRLSKSSGSRSDLPPHRRR